MSLGDHVAIVLDPPHKRLAKPDQREAMGDFVRVVRRAPEVVVKITRGGTIEPAKVRNHARYITRGGKLDAENEQGERIGKQDMRAEMDAWLSDRGRQRPDSKINLNVVMSMPPGTPPDKLYAAVQAVARRHFVNHRYLMVMHTDEAHPHVHVCVRRAPTQMQAGGMLVHGKPELHAWRQSLARELRARGVEANATPRRSRFIARKADRLRGIPAERSTVKQAKYQQAAVDALAGRARTGPWVEAAKRTRDRIEGSYRAIAQDLAGSDKPQMRELARQVEQRVREAPTYETEADRLRRQALALARKNGQTRVDQQGRGPQ